MTWEGLFVVLQSMQAANHTSLKDRVTVIFGEDSYYIDIYESLTSGQVCFAIANFTEDQDD